MRKRQNDELNRLTPEGYQQAEKLPVWVVLDNVRSQNNTGSIFRSCDAFRISGLVLCGITATPPHREIHKTALGAELSVPWRYEDDCRATVLLMKDEGYYIIVVEQAEGAVSPESISLPSNIKTALIFGNEVHGVSQDIVDLADACVEIPQFGSKHSLNIAVSAGIVLWELGKIFASRHTLQD